jgi:hypothetical protein
VAALAPNRKARLQAQKFTQTDILLDPNRYPNRSKQISKQIQTDFETYPNRFRNRSKQIQTDLKRISLRDIYVRISLRDILTYPYISILVIDIQKTYPRLGEIIGYHRICRIS